MADSLTEKIDTDGPTALEGDPIEDYRSLRVVDGELWMLRL